MASGFYATEKRWKSGCGLPGVVGGCEMIWPDVYFQPGWEGDAGWQTIHIFITKGKGGWERKGKDAPNAQFSITATFPCRLTEPLKFSRASVTFYESLYIYPYIYLSVRVRLMAGNVMTGYAFLGVSTTSKWLPRSPSRHHQVDKKFHANVINL